MTAQIIKFPEPLIRPDLARCREAIAICDGDPRTLLFLALNGVHGVYNRVPVKGDCDPAQVAVDRLAISFLAIGHVLGIGIAAEALVS